MLKRGAGIDKNAGGCLDTVGLTNVAISNMSLVRNVVEPTYEVKLNNVINQFLEDGLVLIGRTLSRWYGIHRLSDVWFVFNHENCVKDIDLKCVFLVMPINIGSVFVGPKRMFAVCCQNVVARLSRIFRFCRLITKLVGSYMLCTHLCTYISVVYTRPAQAMWPGFQSSVYRRPFHDFNWFFSRHFTTARWVIISVTRSSKFTRVALCVPWQRYIHLPGYCCPVWPDSLSRLDPVLSILLLRWSTEVD